jgi:hypothetical protein
MNALERDSLSEKLRRWERSNFPVLREAIPFWFAISSPLSGLIIGFLGVVLQLANKLGG